jgi:26S proteasome regulatory subunit N6
MDVVLTAGEVQKALNLEDEAAAMRVIAAPAEALVGAIDWSTRGPKSEADVRRAVAALTQGGGDGGASSVALRRAYLEAVLGVGRAPDEAREAAAVALADVYRAAGDAPAMAALLARCRAELFGGIAKARAAKVMRVVLDTMGEMAGTAALQAATCRECIAWATATKRAFLRQRLQLRLAALMLDTREFGPALQTITALLRELKKLDDKPLLVEALLLESRIHRALHNVPKAKAALTGARTNANAIYCPQRLQAELDVQNGILNADERDFKTAFSYFFEGFEVLHTLNDRRAPTVLKYMLLCKIMGGHADEVAAVVAGKNTQAHAKHPGTAGMQAIARAHHDRSLQAFTAAREEYRAELVDDPIVCVHFDELYSTLLEQNLARLIEPFSCVEIAHVAKLIGLPLQLVERRLSQMILDKKIEGILDQGAGTLILFDDPPSDKTYAVTLDTIASLNRVVDSLYEKATKLLV